MFFLTSEPIDRGSLRDAATNPHAGAISIFEGLVRNHHQGRKVLRLEYEAHRPVAENEGRIILQEAVGGADPVVTAGGTVSNHDAELPGPGTTGEAVSDLFPSGEISIGGKRYQARVALGSIVRGSRVRVTGQQDFSLLVEEAES